MGLNRTRLIANLLVASTFVLLALAPMVMPAGYDFVHHSISESAAQLTPKAWVGRSGLALFGIVALFAARHLWRRERTTAAALIAFGLAMTTSAIWSHRPWLVELPYDAAEDMVHSAAAQISGLAISLAMIARIISRLASRLHPDWLDWAALATVFGGSAGFGLFPAIGGLIQRAMFATVLLWLWQELDKSSRRSQ